MQYAEKAESSKNKFKLATNPTVFFASTAFIILFVGLSLANVELMETSSNKLQNLISENFGWLFISSVNAFLLFSVYLLFSRYGSIRLGGADIKPEYSYWVWFTMLFSAGLGIGLMFFSVAEPIMHLSSPPLQVSNKIEAAKLAMGITFFHWGLHVWAIFSVVGLSLAYFCYNRGLPLTIRSTFYPLLGKKIYGPIGHCIDILAVVATLFGVATSLGLGAQQINAGLNHLWAVEKSIVTQILLIMAITSIATISVVSGIDKGIKRLSSLNVILAISITLFLLIVGPTLFLLDSLIQNIGIYIQRFVELSTWTESYTQTKWQNDWTIFYWAWWISWSPFVGMFIARISKGRTVREFVIGVLLAPTIFTFVWLTVFGNSGIYQELFADGGLTAAVNQDIATALFFLLEKYPFAILSSVIAIVLIVTFFVTSSDSASLVIEIITAGGKTEPRVYQRIYWAFVQGTVAAILLLGGGLKALQTASIASALPFVIVLLFMCYCLLMAFNTDVAEDT